MRRFVAPGLPIPPFAISSGWRRTRGTSTTPNAMPGFGPLDCSDEQLSALIDRILGSVRSAADRVTNRRSRSYSDSNRTAESAPEPPASRASRNPSMTPAQ